MATRKRPSMTEELKAKRDFEKASGAPDTGKGQSSRGKKILEGLGIRSMKSILGDKVKVRKIKKKKK